MAAKQGMLKKHTENGSTTGRAKSARDKATLDLSGTFIGCINCAPTMLIIRQQKAKIQGKLDIAGNVYTLRAECKSMSAEGEISTKHSRDAVDCSLSCREDRLTLKLSVPDPITGQILSMPVRFQRKNTSEASSGRNLLDTVQEHHYCDPVLIGNWQHQDTVTELDAANMPKQSGKALLQMKKNGEYSFNTELTAPPTLHFRELADKGEIATGKWQSRDRVIYLSDPDNQRWFHYARYHVKGARLYLTFSDGSNELWCKS